MLTEIILLLLLLGIIVLFLILFTKHLVNTQITLRLNPIIVTINSINNDQYKIIKNLTNRILKLENP